MRSTASESNAQHRHHLRLQEEHDRGRRRDPQRHRLGALQAADRDARAGAVPRSIRRRSRSCSSRCRRRRRRTPRSRAWPRTSWPTASAASTAWRSSTSTARCGASCRCCCTRRSCASTTSRSPKWSNALRAQNTTAPVGRVKGAARRAEHPPRRAHRVAAASSRTSSSSAAGDEIVRLGQVATVEDGFAELAGFSLRNGHPNVGLSIIRSREASTVSVAERGRASWSTRSTRRCPRARSSRSRRTAARTRRTASTT